MTDTAALNRHWLAIGRGCQFDCSFCGGGKASHLRIAGREGIILRSPGRVVDDLARLQSEGLHQVSSYLNPAIISKAFWSELFGEMRRRGVKIGIYNEFFQLPSKEFIREFVATADLAYSELAITPLSGSDKVRQGNGKHFTNQQLMNVLDQLGSRRIPFFLYFSLNLPGENKKAFQQTLTLVQAACEALSSQSPAHDQHVPHGGPLLPGEPELGIRGWTGVYVIPPRAPLPSAIDSRSVARGRGISEDKKPVLSGEHARESLKIWRPISRCCGGAIGVTELNDQRTHRREVCDTWWQLAVPGKALIGS